MNTQPNNTSAAMREASDRRLREDPDALYYAEYQVDAAMDVAAFVPTKNRQTLESNDLLKRIVISFGTTELPGIDLIDPVLMVEIDGLLEPSFYFLNQPRPDAPSECYCSLCAVWSKVAPTRFVHGVRVVELMLCSTCVDKLDVETS